MQAPFISICIPAYKNAAFLNRLLISINEQTFRDIEVVITDDSSDDSVELVCKSHAAKLPLLYHKNIEALGSPANWNKSISMAKGNWIKIMHHDDWFANKDCLQLFKDNIKPNSRFLFSGFCRIDEASGNSHENIPSKRQVTAIKNEPILLFKENIIGHPSTTLIKNDLKDWYDENLLWVVDFEFYMRCLKEPKSVVFIDRSLINIGMSELQFTKKIFRQPEIELPENLYLINKLGIRILSNPFVYDYYWRSFRNLNIRSVESLRKFSRGNNIPAALSTMINFQKKFPAAILKFGIFSKSLMFLSYLMNKK